MRIRILPSCTFIKPLCFAKRTLLSWRPNPTREFLNSDMERMVGEEVASFTLFWVLAFSDIFGTTASLGMTDNFICTNTFSRDALSLRRV